jgi:hypothetical protein
LLSERIHIKTAQAIDNHSLHNTYFAMTDQPKFDHQCVEIGDKRSTVASVTTNGFCLTQFYPQPGGKLKPKSIAMNVRATKVLDQNLDEIRRTICDLKNGELKDDFMSWPARGKVAIKNQQLHTA